MSSPIIKMSHPTITNFRIGQDGNAEYQVWLPAPSLNPNQIEEYHETRGLAPPALSDELLDQLREAARAGSASVNNPSPEADQPTKNLEGAATPLPLPAPAKPRPTITKPRPGTDQRRPSAAAAASTTTNSRKRSLEGSDENLPIEAKKRRIEDEPTAAAAPTTARAKPAATAGPAYPKARMTLTDQFRAARAKQRPQEIIKVRVPITTNKAKVAPAPAVAKVAPAPPITKKGTIKGPAQSNKYPGKPVNPSKQRAAGASTGYKGTAFLHGRKQPRPAEAAKIGDRPAAPSTKDSTPTAVSARGPKRSIAVEKERRLTTPVAAKKRAPHLSTDHSRGKTPANVSTDYSSADDSDPDSEVEVEVKLSPAETRKQGLEKLRQAREAKAARASPPSPTASLPRSPTPVLDCITASQSSEPTSSSSNRTSTEADSRPRPSSSETLRSSIRESFSSSSSDRPGLAVYKNKPKERKSQTTHSTPAQQQVRKFFRD